PATGQAKPRRAMAAWDCPMSMLDSRNTTAAIFASKWANKTRGASWPESSSPLEVQLEACQAPCKGRVPEMNSIRCMIVDDEPLARRRLRRLLRDHADVEIIAECRSGREAVEAIEQVRADLVFLDVQMPVVDGFDVIAQVGVEKMPPVVFVTA